MFTRNSASVALILCLLNYASATSIWITSSPASVQSTVTSISVGLSYVSTSATSDRTAVIDILDASSNWFGKGSTSIGTTASGAITLTVTPSAIAAGVTYTLKAWIVDTQTYTTSPSTAWQSALAVNTSVTFTTTSSSSSSGSSSSTSGGGGGCNSCKLKYFGVNLSGAEFGDTGANGHILSPNPGTAGTNYVYTEPGGSASWFAARGMNTFRIPVRWERLQSSLTATSLTSSDLTSLKAVINQITSTLGAYAIIDIHNYARYSGNLVNTTFPNSQFYDFWKLLAAEFKTNSKVMFGLMNEPYSMDTDIWVGAANAGIAGIRSTGATNVILVPGNRWTGAHSWTTSNDGNGNSNAVSMLNIVDSGNNYIVEMHQYLDSDYSGTNAACVSNTWGSDALVSATSWLRTNNKKGFLGEFGGGSSALCLTSADYLLSYMENNSDVWVGWTWWSAGPWWGSYFMSVEPSSGNAAVQFSGVLQNHICNSSLLSTCGSTVAGDPNAGTNKNGQSSAGSNSSSVGIGVGVTLGACVVIGGVAGVMIYARRKKIPFKQVFSPRVASPSGNTANKPTANNAVQL